MVVDRLFEHGDPVEKIRDEAESRVVEGERLAEALEASGRGELRQWKAQLTGGFHRRFQQTECDESPDEVGVQT